MTLCSLYSTTVTSASFAILYFSGPAGLSMERTIFFRSSFLASCWSLSFSESSSEQNTTKLPILALELAVVAPSSFLTKIVKSSQAFRAKIISPGGEPFLPTQQPFSPLLHPLTLHPPNQ